MVLRSTYAKQVILAGNSIYPWRPPWRIIAAVQVQHQCCRWSKKKANCCTDYAPKLKQIIKRWAVKGEFSTAVPPYLPGHYIRAGRDFPIPPFSSLFFHLIFEWIFLNFGGHFRGIFGLKINFLLLFFLPFFWLYFWSHFFRFFVDFQGLESLILVILRR